MADLKVGDSKTEPCSLYRTLYLPDHGYVVYRNCFPDSVVVHLGARAHRMATFVCEVEAKEYARARNALIDRFGTDEVKPGKLSPGYVSWREALVRWGEGARPSTRSPHCYMDEDGAVWWPAFASWGSWAGYYREDF